VYNVKQALTAAKEAVDEGEIEVEAMLRSFEEYAMCLRLLLSR
jgi:hypothetical protein